MTSRVVEWTVHADNKPHEIGSGKVVHIAPRYGRTTKLGVLVYTQEYDHDPTGPEPRKRRVQLFYTDAELPEMAEVLGSAIIYDGGLIWIWHVVALWDPITPV